MADDDDNDDDADDEDDSTGFECDLGADVPVHACGAADTGAVAGLGGNRCANLLENGPALGSYAHSAG